MEEKIRNIYNELNDLLKNAPEEDECTEKQNTMYSDMANLKESIYEYIYELE